MPARTASAGWIPREPPAGRRGGVHPMILALDTATGRPSVALGTPGGEHVEAVLDDRQQLSRRLADVVKDLCRDRGIAPAAVRGIVVADGPGSFTGIRIGVAFAKGFHDALGVPLHAAPSLLGAARAACPGAGTVVAEYGAQRGDVFRAVYRFAGAGGAPEVLLAPTVTPAATPVDPGHLRASERHASAAALLHLLGRPGGPAAIAAPSDWQPAYGRPAEAEARRLARDADRG